MPEPEAAEAKPGPEDYSSRLEGVEDDPANMVANIAGDVVNCTLCIGDAPTEAGLQQLRDALAKFVDARIAAAIKQAKP